MNGLPLLMHFNYVHSKHNIASFVSQIWPPSSLTVSLVVEDKVVVFVYPQHGGVGEPAGVSGKDIFIAGEQLDERRAVALQGELETGRAMTFLDSPLPSPPFPFPSYLLPLPLPSPPLSSPTALPPGDSFC